MLKFRKASKADLPVLNRISVESKKHWVYPEEWIENWKEDLTLKGSDLNKQIVVVAELEDQTIGFCAIKENPENYEIMHLWISPTFIGKGFGEKLLAYSLDISVIKDKPVIVISDPNASGFYEKQGFITFDRIESYPKGRFLPILQKN